MVLDKAIVRERIERCYQLARDALLAERNERGWWTGELSASALSTATAVMALHMVQHGPGSHAEREARNAEACGFVSHSARRIPSSSPPTCLIAGGLEWLARHQNDDGGWGDTTKSLSNISTTMLARAVFHATGAEDDYRVAVEKAQAWIDRAGGVQAVLKRYGKDRTFSIPILTHCALAGLVDWNDVLPLPFELACLPPRFYKTARLPVVSYALPALIAIGQVRHHFRKPWNPLTRFVRWLAKRPSLRRLEQIQPANGGFLEATPLTSFVTMSLAGMGRSQHPVAQKGAQFLIDSVRPDGSWPIDTNLATWVTTLSVNALGDDLPEDTREPILRWLLDQQYKEVHPYTNADPGGWAWTDLPGGVPDADDTPGALLTLMRLHDRRALEVGTDRSEVRGLRPGPTSRHPALRNAIRWLLDLQNRNGGWPTFCRGWGKLAFDRSAPDITAHALRALIGIDEHDEAGVSAYIHSLVRSGRPDVRIRLAEDSRYDFFMQRLRAIAAGFRFLRKHQRADGSWLPLWFGNQHASVEQNPTYGTARVLAAYRDADEMDFPVARRGFAWLVTNQNPDGGWGAGPGTPSSVEETALATEILLSFEPQGESARRGLRWLLNRVEDGGFREPAPIGFYFAKLWYFERLYPLIFTVAALRRARQVYSAAEKSAEHAARHAVE